MAHLIGQSLLHYQVTAKLGEGGMGEVYQARDGRLGRDVAIKVLPEIFLADDERLARFEREAQLLASLNHPNIGAIYGLEEADDKRFLVLELIDGETLQELIRKGLPLERALEMAAQVARALETAHEQGIVHRDLKPANVKVTPSGQVKVLDFGLAKAWAPEPGDPHISASPTLTAQMTQAGVILGTAAYMSPEQARGQEVDKRADIWSFGVLTYEMLTGHELFAGDTVTDTLAAVVRAEPDWEALPQRTPARVQEILARCLEKDPAVRLRDVGEARIALEGAEPEVPAPVAAAPGAPTSRFAWLPWSIATVAVVAAVLAVVGILPPRREAPAPVLSLPVDLFPEASYESFPPSFAFSPDGRQVVHAEDEGEAQGLFVRDLARAETRGLSGTSGASLPFYSPDGEWIAYFDGTRMRKVSARGGAPLTLVEKVPQGRGGSWGRDGFIYYAPDTSDGIWQVPAEGGEPEQLTVPTEGEDSERSHRWPQALPDGRHLLMTVQPRGSDFDDANIELVDLESGERTVVVRGGSMGRLLPTGHLLFVREGTVYASPFDVAEKSLARSPAPVLEGVSFGSGWGGAELVVSSDGTLLYQAGGVASDSELELVRVQADGTVEPLSATAFAYRRPTFSPDQSRLLFDAGREGAPSDIWSLDLERDVATRLTFWEGPDFGPIWSPDGRRFAFSSGRGGGSPNLWIKRAEGTTEAERLTEADAFQVPTSWSPDGRHILFYQGSNEGDIRVADVETGEVEDYLVTEFAEGSSSFSPDGLWVAYSSNESGQYEVYIRSFPLAPGKWRVSTGGGSDVSWSPDGRTVHYMGPKEFYAAEVAFEGGAVRVGTPVPLFEDRFFDTNGRHYDVAADGSFVFLLGEDTGPRERLLPHMVFNWFRELERLVPLER